MQIACLPAVALTCPRGWVTRDVGGEAEYDADDVVIELLEHTPMFCFVFFFSCGLATEQCFICFTTDIFTLAE